MGLFKGNVWEFTIKSLLFAFLDIITFGISTPAHLYWTVVYFIRNSR